MNKKEIQQECKKLFEEIKQLQEALSWNDVKLYRETFVWIFDDMEDDKDKDNERKFIEKTKKIFQRKSWDCDKASNHTRLELEKIRNAIYLCEDYKKNKICDSDIPLGIMQHIQRESEKLEKFLRKEDY